MFLTNTNRKWAYYSTLILGLLFLSACESNTTPTETPALTITAAKIDDTVVDLSSTSTSTNVDFSPTISLTFSQDITASQLETSAKVSITDGNNPVTLTYTQGVDAKTVLITSSSPLAANSTYTVTVAKDLSVTAGDKTYILAAATAFTFATISQSTEAVLNSLVLNIGNVIVAGTIGTDKVVTFLVDDKSTVNSATVTSIDISDDATASTSANNTVAAGTTLTFDASKTLTLTVTAEDGSTTQDYALTLENTPFTLSFGTSGDDAPIMGMREFMLTAIASNFKTNVTKDSLIFIVGESAAPPSWTFVNASPAKLTRAFSTTKTKRNIYFSTTERMLADTDPKFLEVDLNSQTLASEDAYIKTQAPGIMLAGTTYYVHVYTSAGIYIKSQDVQTASYPDFTTNPLPTQYDDTNARPFGSNKPSWDNYAIGLSMWKTDPDDKTSGFKTIEAIKGEMNLAPLRYLSMFDFEKNSWNLCNSTNRTPFIQGAVEINSNYSILCNTPFSSDKLSFSGDPGTTFVAINRSKRLPSAKRNQVIDAMIEKKDYVLYNISLVCFDSSPNSVTSPSSTWTFNYVTE